MSLVRYSEIKEGMKREFLLLQGTGCRWKRCTFCDYYDDVSPDPFSTNKAVLDQVTGKYGTLDIINSGSAPEFDAETVKYIVKTVKEKNIKDLWFEAHWMYRNVLSDFSSQFPCHVHFRTGVESFNPALRASWNKGIDESVTPEMIRQYFEGVCLLVGVKGQTEKDVMESAAIAEKLFSYYSVNMFTPNSTTTERDDALCRIIVEKIAPQLRKSRKAEVLIENTDLGVG